MKLGVFCVSGKSGIRKSPGGFAFSNASLSYCLRFGGRRESFGPEQTIEELIMAAKKKAKKATKKKAAKKKKKK